MKDSSHVEIVEDPVKEARRYVQNAKDILNEKAISKRDLKLLTLVNVGYDAIHLSMGYDGNPRKASCQDGIQLANDIIDRCAALLPS